MPRTASRDERPPERRPFVFVLVLVVITLPFWVAGFLTDQSLLGIDFLPISALMVFNPLLAALVLVCHKRGVEGGRRFLRVALDPARITEPLWLLPAIGLIPVVVLTGYALGAMLHGSIARYPVSLTVLVVYTVVFLLSAAGEELGWQGYVFDSLQARWDAFGAALFVGGVWAVWHAIPYYQAGQPLSWIVWQCALTVGYRVVITWLYNNSGRSVLVAILAHASINVSTFGSPVAASTYDPFFVSVVLFPVVTVIVPLWGRRTLSEFRFQRTE